MLFSMFAQENQKAVFLAPQDSKKPTNSHKPHFQAKTPHLVRNTTLKGTPLTSKDSVFAQQTSKRKKKGSYVKF
jgi:hypothetical protein